MAFVKLQFIPGINRDLTNYTGEHGWWDCDKIRFHMGFPQKLGGWEKYTSETLVGTCRQFWNWVTTYGDNILVVPTNEKVYLEVGGVLNNVTPLRASNPTLSTPDTDNSISATDTSTTVTVDLGVAHGATTGNWVTISGVATDIGGIPVEELNADHKVTVTSTTQFTFEVDTAATSTVPTSGGTAIVIDFEYDVGFAVSTIGLGWGAGTWSRGYWGLGSPSGGVFLQQQDWWASNFDNDLSLNIRNGAGFWWERGTNTDPSSALATRIISLPDYATAQGFTASAVPVKIGQLMVSQQDKHLIAFGAVPFGSTNTDDFDPLLVRWSDQDSPANWTPQVTNSAGDIRLSRGSRIVVSLPTRQEILVFTDSNLYSMQFLGTTDVFGFQEYSDNISIASPRAVISASNITYWMGKDKFYAYTGRVESLACPLSEFIFDNLNLNQRDQIISGLNERWNEVWWFYPDANSDWNNRYVVFNYGEQVWYMGSMERTAWLDSSLRETPQAANTTNPTVNTTGYIYNHEYTLNADGEPMSSYIQSNDFDLDNGDKFMLTKRIIPDISFVTSVAATPSVTLETRHRDFPGDPLSDDAEDNKAVTRSSVDNFTTQVFVRARGRQAAMKIVSEDMDVFWRLGSPRLDVRPSGKR